MFKDTLKNKYNKFGSIDDVVAKSKELDMAPRLYTVLRAYDLLDNYMALKVKPLRSQRYSADFCYALRTVIQTVIKDIDELGKTKSYIRVSESIPESTIMFICLITGLPVIFYCLTNNIYIIGENRTLRLYWCHM